MSANEPLAILAGGGPMPGIVADAAIAAGRRVFIIGIEGEADAVARYPHEIIRWGQLGRLEELLVAHGSKDIVLVGSIVRRPDIAKLSLDWGGLKAIPKLMKIMAGGDDSVLSGVVRYIESNGYRVLGAHEVAGDLVSAPGCLTRRQPSDKDRLDIERAGAAAIAIGRLDAGQGAVSSGGHIIALEGLEGTDAMVERVRSLHESGRANWRGRVGVLAKWAKPQQDLRVDMPTIGPTTVKGVAEAGLAGIAIEAGRVMIADRAATIAAADAADLFLVAETLPESGRPA